MNRSLSSTTVVQLFALALLTAVAACSPRSWTGRGAAHASDEHPQVATATWGATDPGAEVQWTYDSDPAPPFEGSPDYALTQVAFPRESARLDREAKGALRTIADDMIAGGDAPELQEMKLLVVGFADGVTERAGAEELGLQRARAARAHLTTLGFREENIQVASFGARYSRAEPWEKMQQQFERVAWVWVLR